LGSGKENYKTWAIDAWSVKAVEVPRIKKYNLLFKTSKTVENVKNGFVNLLSNTYNTSLSKTEPKA
jgi:hypothetical protein